MGLDTTFTRTKKAQETARRDAISVQTRILDAAQCEFMRAGYAGANTNTMALNGVSKATIFRHYPTKRVLFEAVVARIAARWPERIDAGSIIETEPREWLRAFAFRALRWILSDEALFVGRMAIADGPDHDQVREIWVENANDPVIAPLVERFSEWQAAKLFSAGDPRRRAVMFLDLILAGRVSRALYGTAEPKSGLALKRHVNDCVDLFIHGCGTLEPHPAPALPAQWPRRRSGG